MDIFKRAVDDFRREFAEAPKVDAEQTLPPMSNIFEDMNKIEALSMQVGRKKLAAEVLTIIGTASARKPLPEVVAELIALCADAETWLARLELMAINAAAAGRSGRSDHSGSEKVDLPAAAAPASRTGR